VKDDTTEVHLNFTGADNFVGATSAAPVQLLNLDWSDSFTSPQTTDNRMAMLSANGLVKATPTLTFSGVTYYRWFQQKHIDANLADVVPCGGPPDIVCFGDDPLTADLVIGPGGRTELFNPDVDTGPSTTPRKTPTVGACRGKESRRQPSWDCTISSCSAPATIMGA
jgi:hypothetical protein